MRRTKIVCTLGPASEQPETLQRLIEAGMDVCRLNFSHGSYTRHRDNLRLIRDLSAGLQKPLAVVQDLQGPKIRIGSFAEGQVTLQPKKTFVITNREVPGDGNEVSTTYQNLPTDVHKGDQILLDDGLIELRVVDTTETDVACEIIHGGPLSDHKGINLPGVTVSTPSVTEKDKRDLAFGIDHDVDFVAISFVRSPDDVAEVKQIITDRGKNIPVIAKIEKNEAIQALDEIIKVADGVMVARGDLGVELPLEDVPVLQKRIISTANRSSKVVITATQMLDSMMFNPRPTRAEASDVANAIFDGTDAVMLSGETAVGKYPVKAVEYMARIAEAADHYLAKTRTPETELHHVSLQGLATNASGHAACTLAYSLGAKMILTFTEQGFTPLMVSKYRPKMRILAATPKDTTRHRLALYWGVESIETPEVGNFETMVTSTIETLKSSGYVTIGDIAVVTGSIPRTISGSTNTIKVHIVE